MKILHVNKFLYRRGGAESYMLDVADRQQDAGHEVAFYAMQHPENDPSHYQDHFPEYLELEPPPSSAAARIGAAARIIYSPQARRGLDGVLREFQPDVAHLHNIYHHLSPSVLRALEDHHVPAVMTLHDYKLACPTYRFLAHGQICEACLGGRFRHAALKRCNRGSLVASALNGLELRIHTSLGMYDPVSAFICPSSFMALKMEQAGVYPDRLHHLRHFVDAPRNLPADTRENRALYVGRLSPEKGVHLLVKATAARNIPLDIAGDGPQLEELQALVSALRHPAVTFHGRVGSEHVRQLMQRAAVSVLPALWYENQPMAILESFASAAPVIGSSTGGIPELISDGEDGYLVEAGDLEGLADRIERLCSDPELSARMGAAGREKVLADFSPEEHLVGLHRLYRQAGASD